MKYIDIHTHFPCKTDVFCIQDIIIESQSKIPKKGFFSAGIHPWYLENWQTKIKVLKQFSESPRILAVGECGLDLQKKVLEKNSIEFQKNIFQFQINLAQTLRKPLIIHCVKCFEELIQIKKQNSPTQIPWIIHGFSKNKTLAQQLINQGFYLSFGKHLFSNQKNREALKSINLNKVFFETDETQISIQKIYWEASKILEMEEEKLIKQINNNFSQVFDVK